MTRTRERWAETHDPSDSKPYSFRFELVPDATITAQTVEVVDPETDEVDATSALSIESVASGQIGGLVWGVTFYPVGGLAGVGAEGREYFVRCTIETDETPVPGRYQHTQVLVVAQR